MLMMPRGDENSACAPHAQMLILNSWTLTGGFPTLELEGWRTTVFRFLLSTMYRMRGKMLMMPRGKENSACP